MTYESRPGLTRRMHVPKRRTGARLAAALTVSVLTLTACSGGAEEVEAGPAEVVELTFWDTDARTGRTERLETLIGMFEEEHPNITVEYVGLPSDSYMQKVDTAIATDSTPDLITMKASDISALVAQGALAPLDDRIEEAGLTELLSEGMVTSARAAAGDDKIYLTPTTSLTDVLWYRSDLFEEAGLGTPTTWDDFFTAAETLTDKETGQFGYTIRGGAGFWSQFVGMVLPMAGVASYFDEDGKAVFTQPEVVAAAERYAGLYNTVTAQSDLTADFKVMVAQFGGGSAAMLSHSIGSYPDHVAALGEENVMAAAAFPSDENGVRVQAGLVLGFSAFEKSEHPDEAWEFLQYVMEAEGDGYWAKESGYIPGNLEVAEQDWVKESQPIAVSLEAMAEEDTVPLDHPYYLPEFSAITGTELLPEWQKTLQGEQTVEEFMQKTAVLFNEARAAYDARQ
ncbi:sugar ABC transporter substrate-binding protein [Cellulomonas sp. KRMCY2]|uniref:ABC transporter substrate-binding protein n=1 Tax=Cellulomonas sp. KRMCY2 TaxID=1304865 RepID=UPI0018CC3DCE|nr:sugar ABC transporter substrate-binding protein [Cellulomonas sp. KRMCY2]